MNLRCDATTAECLVYTYREGIFSAVGHDLCLRVSRFSVDLGEGDAIAAEFDATSLRATGAVSAGDARRIESNAADDVLRARRFPTITFRSTQVVRRNGKRARVHGSLTLHGVTRPISFEAVSDAEGWRADVRLDQRDFGIRPFTAMLGALRVRADVLVRIRVPHT